MSNNMSKNIILGVTGSIAAYKALQITSELRKRNIDVVVIMTDAAQKFITPLSFKSLSQQEVITDLFINNSGRDPLHVALSDSVDLVVIAPASADIIGKIAAGISDDALTCTVMASSATKVIVPAMEGRMYNNPIVQSNITKLEGLGYKFLGPVSGRLASGAEDIGRMAEASDVVEEISRQLALQ